MNFKILLGRENRNSRLQDLLLSQFDRHVLIYVKEDEHVLDMVAFTEKGSVIASYLHEKSTERLPREDLSSWGTSIFTQPEVFGPDEPKVHHMDGSAESVHIASVSSCPKGEVFVRCKRAFHVKLNAHKAAAVLKSCQQSAVFLHGFLMCTRSARLNHFTNHLETQYSVGSHTDRFSPRGGTSGQRRNCDNQLATQAPTPKDNCRESHRPELAQHNCQHSFADCQQKKNQNQDGITNCQQVAVVCQQRQMNTDRKLMDRQQGVRTCSHLERCTLTGYRDQSCLQHTGTSLGTEATPSVRELCFQVGIIINLQQPGKEYIDLAWDQRVNHLVGKKGTLEDAMSWLNTLGGGYSALGDYFSYHAEQAGRISLRQLHVALTMGDPPTVIRCRLYIGLSLMQRGFLRWAKHIIREQYHVALKQSSSDHRLLASCQGLWSRLRYLYSLRKRNEHPPPHNPHTSSGLFSNS